MRATFIRWLLLAVALGAYLAMVLRHTCYFAAGPDSSGYLNEAKLLASGRVRLVLEPLRTFNLGEATMIYAFTPLGFGIGGHGTIVPTYPAGAPLHFVAAAKIGGWEIAPFLVGPLASIGCLLLIYAIGSELGLAPILRVAAMAILGFAPFFLEHAVQPVSDVLAAFWALATMWCALRAPARPGLAAAAGVAFGISVWVRPTNILLALPLAFAWRFRIRQLLLAAAGALPFGVMLMWFSHRLYGGAFSTGYGSTSGIFKLHTIPTCFPAHFVWLAKLMTPLVMPLGLLVVFDRRLDRWLRATLVVWFGIFFTFYAGYDVCGEWFSERFLLPAIPALIIGALLITQAAVERFDRPYVRVIAAVLVVAILANEVDYCFRRFHVLGLEQEDSIYPEAVHWAEQQVPSNALVFSGLLSGAFLYYSDRFTCRYDQIDEQRYPALQASAASELPWYAVVSVVETDGADLARRMPGRWTEVGSYRSVKIWRHER